jgi:phosphohistidine phosphatase
VKTLVLVRHAKSSWDHPGMRDIQRPLGARGKRDAPRMAELLLEKGIRPDKLVSSPAQRAHDTAVFFAKALGTDHWDIALVEEIYEALPDTLQAVVSRLDNDWDTVLLFGHNPGFTIFANRFAEGFRFDNVPTCGVVVVKGEVDFWSEFIAGNARITEWYFPKEHAL